MSGQALQPLPPQPQIVIQPAAPVQAPQAPQDAGSSWGFSTISSCCSSLDDCTGNYLSAIATAIKDLWVRFLNWVFNENERSDPEPQIGLQGLPAGVDVRPAAGSLTQEAFMRKWSQIQPIGRGQPGFQQQGEEWYRDLFALPENYQHAVIQTLMFKLLRSPEDAALIFPMLAKQCPGDRAILDAITRPQVQVPAQAPAQPQEISPPITRITCEAFIKNWKGKKPPAKPKVNASQDKKAAYERMCTEWLRDLGGLPDAITGQITFKLQAEKLASLPAADSEQFANAFMAAINPEDFEARLKARVADPAIIAIVENFVEAPVNPPAPEYRLRPEDILYD